MSENFNSGPSYDQLANRNYQQGKEFGINIFELFSILVKRIKLIFYSIGFIVIVSIVTLLLIPNKYTSTASILPTGAPDQLSDLKSLAGIGISSLGSENPSELFPSILESRHINNALVSKKYSFLVDGNPMTLTLQEYFGENDFDKLFLALADITSITTDKKTGVIHLAIETKYPAFSQALVAKYIRELENYNIYKRRSKAKESEEYLAKQLSAIKEELSTAEDELERFQTENSDWHISTNSTIIKTFSRLSREVEIKSSLYLFMTQEYEKTKFEAQKDVPIIQILDSPSLPTLKSGPHRTMILLLIILLSLFLIIFIIFVYEAIIKYSKAQGKESLDEIKIDLQKTFPSINKFISGKKVQ